MNKHEREIAEALERRGWTVLSCGWPDLLCVDWSKDELRTLTRRDEQVPSKPLRAFAVELKRRGHSCTSDQRIMHAVLNAIGLPCRVAEEPQIRELLQDGGASFGPPISRRALELELGAVEAEMGRAQWQMEECRRRLAEIQEVLGSIRDVRVIPNTKANEGE